MRRRLPRKYGREYFFLGLYTLAALAVAVGTIFVIYIAVIIKQLPSPEQFGLRQVSQSTKLYDRTGKILLYEIHGEEKRTIIAFEEIPEYVKQATLAAEDADFYSGPAFDWKAIIRAFLVNLKEGRVSQGGSTITQQLAKNVFLSPEKTVLRKIKELVLAVRLERKYSKDEIFSFYLNQVPYGSNAYGVEAASITYFGRSVRDVGLGEAALLAAMLKAPSYYSPWGSHQEELFERQARVLSRMVELGFIKKSGEVAAKAEKISLTPPSLGSIQAPHFSLAVKDYLVGRYGEDLVLRGGLKVTTSLDFELQKEAERVVLEGAERNAEFYEGKNAALVAQDPKTGQILALVGSKDYFNIEEEGNFNVAVQGLRQPGSALKPFVYLTAFKKGFFPETVLFDVLTEFDTTKDPEKSYKPHNYDGVFRGPVKMKDALAQSINVPSVKTLYLAGFDDVLKTVHDLGIGTLKERWRYGLSLVLGGGEVRLVDLVNAYASLSQEGVRHNQVSVLKVEKNDGEVLEEFADKSERVFDAEYVRMINEILSDKDLRRPLFQNSLSLTAFPDRDVALKTGTTNDYRDAWALGYSPNLVLGVWAGNNDNAPMQRRAGSILAAVPIWHAFLEKALQKYPLEIFEKPSPYSLPKRPMLNGEVFFSPVVGGVSLPQIHPILFYINPRDPQGPPPENPAADPQFDNWERGVLEWAKTNVPNLQSYNLPLPPGISYESINQETKNKIIFASVLPSPGSFVSSPFIISARIVSPSERPLRKVEARINNKILSSASVYGNVYNYQYYFQGLLESQNLIEIEAEDSFGSKEITRFIVFRK